jgi:hypothetical protein
MPSANHGSACEMLLSWSNERSIDLVRSHKFYKVPQAIGRMTGSDAMLGVRIGEYIIPSFR